jgi:hypothetical protein
MYTAKTKRAGCQTYRSKPFLVLLALWSDPEEFDHTDCDKRARSVDESG